MKPLARPLAAIFLAVATTTPAYAQETPPAKTQEQLKNEAYARAGMHIGWAITSFAFGYAGLKGSQAMTKYSPQTAAFFATASTTGLAISVSEGIAGLGVLALAAEGNYKGAIKYSDDVKGGIQLTKTALSQTGGAAIVWISAAGYNNQQVMNRANTVASMEHLATSATKLRDAVKTMFSKSAGFMGQLKGTAKLTYLLKKMHSDAGTFNDGVIHETELWKQEMDRLDQEAIKKDQQGDVGPKGNPGGPGGTNDGWSSHGLGNGFGGFGGGSSDDDCWTVIVQEPMSLLDMDKVIPQYQGEARVLPALAVLNRIEIHCPRI